MSDFNIQNTEISIHRAKRFFFKKSYVKNKTGLFLAKQHSERQVAFIIKIIIKNFKICEW